MTKKIFIIAGEASGDMHGANLMHALYSENENISIAFWGGDRMAAEGGTLHKHISELAFMGFWEVFVNIRTILSNFKKCKKDIQNFKPDVLVLIDYPGFNLRMAEWAKKEGIKVFYYISPQVWAWKQKRVFKIREVVDQMCVILPFETAFYSKYNYDVEYVGHPLLDEIHRWKNCETLDLRQKYHLSEKPIIAVLPGSRVQEIKRKLPIMLSSLENLDSHQIIIAGAPNFDQDFYSQFTNNRTIVVFGETYSLLNVADLAVVTSGTATLETALFEVPEVVCYKGSSLSYQIAKRLVNIEYISLVNLIMGKEVVKELIQGDCTASNIRSEIDKLITDKGYRKTMLDNMIELKDNLGGGGASKKVAQSLLKTISDPQ